MIKIIQGVYGFWNGHMVVPKTVNDEPFTETPEQEERLVKLGVAGYVNIPPSIVAETATVEEVDELPVNLEDMTVKELKVFAEPYGVKYKVGTGKDDFIEAIKKAMNKEQTAEIEEIEDDEEPPTFDPTEAVL